MPRLHRRVRSNHSHNVFPLVLAEDTPSVLAFASVPLTIEAAATEADGKPKLPRISMEAYTGASMRLPGWKMPVIVDLSGMEGTGKPIQVLRNHDGERIIGHGTATIVDGRLRLEGVVSSSSADARDVVELAGNGCPFQASIGAEPKRVQFLKNSRESAQVNGQTVVGPMAIVRQSRLYEISVVGNGADHNTSTSVAASFSPPSERVTDVNWLQWLQARGFEESNLSETQLASLKAMYQAEQDNGDDNKKKSSTVAAMVEAARKRQEREERYGEVIQAALDRGMSPDDAESLVQAAIADDMDRSNSSFKYCDSTALTVVPTDASRSL